MKKNRIVILTAITVLLGFNAGAQTLTSVIGETISFLQNKTPQANSVRSALIEFAITDNLNDFGTISGRANLVVDSTVQMIGTKGIKKFFLRSGATQWINTNTSTTASNKTFTFTTPLLLTAASTLTITSSRGTSSNSVRYDMPAFKTNNSAANGANEYIISGFIDSSNPKKYVTIRIVMQFIFFG